jgi:hypothetical protein
MKPFHWREDVLDIDVLMFTMKSKEIFQNILIDLERL